MTISSILLALRPDQNTGETLELLFCLPLAILMFALLNVGMCKQSSRRGPPPLDLRRTCARLCHQVCGELEQIRSQLGHVSIPKTERYLRCKQRFQNAVIDHIGLEPDVPS